MSVWSQVGIGNNPDASAQLDVSASDKGVLLPRVSLNDVTDSSLDGTNTAQEGLVIYNTNADLPGGKGFYYFDGNVWQKMIPNPNNIYVVPIDTGQITITNTSGEDVQGYDSALEPIFFNDTGKIEVKLIVRCSEIVGTVEFQLHAYDNTDEKWPITNSDFGIYASTHQGYVATSDWVKWDAGTNAHEIHLFAWISSGNSGDKAVIESAYLLVRSQ